MVSERNLLNKWFQDSIKSYFLESVASPLLIEHLQFQSSQQLKSFVHKQVDKSKPKYMGIIEQYFILIKQSNKQDQFVQKLKDILKNPTDITQKNIKLNYNAKKAVRKQFVSYLILKYFEIYEQQQLPSFFELWNICFPQKAQEKKKLSKFDIIAQNQIKNDNSQMEIIASNHEPSSQNVFDHYFCQANQLCISNENLNQQNPDPDRRDGVMYNLNIDSYFNHNYIEEQMRQTVNNDKDQNCYSNQSEHGSYLQFEHFSHDFSYQYYSMKYDSNDYHY